MEQIDQKAQLDSMTIIGILLFNGYQRAVPLNHILFLHPHLPPHQLRQQRIPK